MNLPCWPGSVVTSYRPGATSVPPVKTPEPRVTAVPLTCLVGGGLVVVVVVVVVVVDVVVDVVVGVMVGVPHHTGALDVCSGAAANTGWGWVLVDPATGGDVVVVVLVVGVVPGGSGGVPLPVSVCVGGPCNPVGTEAEPADDGFPDDGIKGRPDAAPVIGNGVVYPLAAMASGGRGEESGLRATDTTIATMPNTEAAPITFCRRWMFVFCRRGMFISHPNALPC